MIVIGVNVHKHSLNAVARISFLVDGDEFASSAGEPGCMPTRLG